MPITMLKALWNYRGFILGNVKREFQSKYRNSLLGSAWTVLNPLAMIIVYTVIFSEVMQAKLAGSTGTYAYSIYLCAGVLTWGLFSEIVMRAQGMFIDNANFLKKINFPRMCLPITVVANSLVNFGIIFSLFTLFLIFTGNFPGVVYIALIPAIIVLVVFAIGLGITIGVLNVFFRDVGQFFGIFIQFWFWLTPIVYPMTILPAGIKPYVLMNPIAGVIGIFQSVLVKGIWPDWMTILPASVSAIILSMLGLHLFRKHAGEMVDEL